MSPCSAATSWVMTLNSVLLPLPLRPTNPMREPARNPDRSVFDQQPAGNADGKVVDDEHGALYGRQRGTKQPIFHGPDSVGHNAWSAGNASNAATFPLGQLLQSMSAPILACVSGHSLHRHIEAKRRC